jgi:uncharacterized protein YndB with AHSA1/START domain/DNA-binding transcriptional ArsR family regulator
VDVEEVFKALADPNRRSLLDALRERDGQALSELEKLLPVMTRFGVMKHLRLLEAASLVTTRRDGRRKLHFLNPVPIQLIADRWISRYAQPWTAALVDLKSHLEAAGPMTSPKHVYELYIRTSPERLWQAITDPEFTQRYYHDTRVASGWQPGDSITYTWTDGTVTIDGEILEADAPRRLVHSFKARWEQNDDPPTTVTWEITPMGSETCLLVMTHAGFTSENATYESVKGGWPVILSGLKTLLETGEPLKIEAPAEVSA